VLTIIMLMLPRLSLRSATGASSNALDAMLLLPVVLATGCFWMLGRGYAAPGVAVEPLLETVREVLGQMGYSARESVPRAGEHELMIKDVGVVVTVSAPWWSGSARLRVQPAEEIGMLRQVVTAVNVLLALGPYEVRSALRTSHAQGRRHDRGGDCGTHRARRPLASLGCDLRTDYGGAVTRRDNLVAVGAACRIGIRPA
jgi:hypothetical protein